MIGPDRLAALLSYNPETGKLYYRPRSPNDFKSHGERSAKRFNRMHAGKEAFTGRCDGYCHGSVDGKKITAHRAAWIIANGQLPDGEIDHINGDRADNRLCNLREVSRAENCQNRAIGKLNKSGIIGVFWSKRQKRWGAHIGVGHRVTKHLGWFKDIADAAAARRAAESELGFHPNHGRRA